MGDTLVRVISCVGYTFQDIENKIVVPEPPLYDVTFVSAKISSVQMQLHSERTAVEFFTSKIDFFFHDLANIKYSGRITLKIPYVTLSLLDKTAKVRPKEQYPVTMIFKTSVMMTNFIQKADFHDARKKQQDHITLHDAPFHRCPFLLDKEHRESPEYIQGPAGGIVPSIPLPSVAPAMTRDTMKFIDPHLTGLFAVRDRDDLNSSSASSRTKYSSTAMSSSEESDADSFTSPIERSTTQASSSHDIRTFPDGSVENQFLAPHSWRHFVALGDAIGSPDGNFVLDPSSDYTDSPDSDGYGLDERYMHDSFVVQFGPVEGYMSAPGIVGVQEVLTSFVTSSVSMESTMDRLQIEMFERIQQINAPLKRPKVINVQIVVPSVTVKYGRIQDQPTRDFNYRYTFSEQNHVFLNVGDLNLAMRIKEPEPKVEVDVAPDSKEHLEKLAITVSARLASISLGIRKGVSTPSAPAVEIGDYSPLSFQLESAEAWWHEKTESHGLLKVSGTDLMVLSSQIPWITHFIDERITELKLISETSQLVRSPDALYDRTAYVVYMLAKAGVDFRVERDPYVLTRPAFVIQSPDHIRASFSWKIIQRLRHVLRSVPREWVEEKTWQYVANSEDLPKDVGKRVIEIFSTWRPWEFTDISKSLIFPFVFGEQSFIEGHILSQPTTVSLEIESFSLRLQHDDAEDYLLFDYLTVAGSWRMQEPDTSGKLLAVEAGVRFMHIRTRLSYKIATVATTLQEVLKDVHMAQVEKQMSAPDPVPVKTLDLPAIRLSASVILDSYATDLIMPSLEMRLQGGGSSVSLLGHVRNKELATGSVVVQVERTAIGLAFKSNNITESLFDCQLKGFKASFLREDSTTLHLATVGAEEFTSALHADAAELLRVMQQVIEVDLEHLKSLCFKDASNDDDDAASMHTITRVPSLELPVVQVSLELVRFQFSAALLPSVSVELRATGMNHKLHFEKSSAAGVFSIASHDVDLFTGMARSRAVKISTRESSMTARVYHGEFLSVEALAGAHATEIAFMPLPEILKFFHGNALNDEVKIVEHEIDALQSAKKAKSLHTPSESTGPPVRMPVSSFKFGINSVSLVAPMYGYIAHADTNELRLEFKNMKDLEFDGGSKQKTDFVVSLAEQTLGLQTSPEAENVTIVSLQLGIGVQGETTASSRQLIYDAKFESEHFHVLLSPEITHYILRLSASLAKDIRAFAAAKEDASAPIENVPASPAKLDSDKDNGLFREIMSGIDKITENASCSILLSHVALSWMFDESHSSGFVFGYESLQFDLKHLRANMMLRNVYATPIPEDLKTFQNSNPADLPNTAFLPSVELIASISEITKAPSVALNLKGESVRLIYTPQIVLAGRELLASVTQTLSHEITQDLFGGTSKRPAAPVKRKKTVAFRLPFSLVLGLKFDGAVIELWEESSFYQRSEKVPPAPNTTANPEYSGYRPALMLETPALYAHVEYRHSAEAPQAHDAFDMFVLITSSANVLYPRLIPVVMRMSALMTEAMEERRSKAIEALTTPAPDEAPADLEPTEEPSDAYEMEMEEMVELFSEVDFSMKVQFERQELTLSCLPTAKVEATVALDSWYVGANTTESVDSGRLLVVSAELANFKTSLQHIYSREISGYVGLRHVMFTGFKNKHMTEPLRASARISDFDIEVNLKQMQDLELFQDIWLPRAEVAAEAGVDAVAISKETTAEPADADDAETSAELAEGMLSKYWKPAAGRMAIPWSIVISVNNSTGSVDLGQSIGRWSLAMDRWWLVLRKTSEWEQHMSTQFDEIVLKSEGRLGGQIALTKLRMRTAIMWEKNEPVPLVQAVLTFSSFEAALSLDYHLFCIVTLQRLGFSTTNQRGVHGKLGDKLLVNGECASFTVLTTALVASNFYDVYQTLARLRVASNASYEAILQDSSEPFEPKFRPKSREETTKVKEIMTNLRTFFDFRVDSVGIFVFPNNFRDEVVFSVRLGSWLARFIQRQVVEDDSKTLESKIVLDSDGCQVALATMKRTFDKDLTHSPPTEFADFVRDAARGGTIINVPTLRIKMGTWQPAGTFTVEHLFTSSIGGKVDVGWNLGSINLIRDMWAIHARALASRVGGSKRKPSAESLDENLREVELDSTYTYVACEPPIIATPQLRDMGEATPPMEWLGLHRQKIPGLVYQTVIRGFQKSTGEIGKFCYVCTKPTSKKRD